MINRTKKLIYILYGLLAYLVPMAILLGAKHDVYFQDKKTTLTIFGVIIIAMILLVFKKKLLKGNTLSLIIGHLVIIVLLRLPEIIADEITLAVSVSIAGLCLSAVFERVEEFYRRTSYNADGTLNRDSIPDKQAWAEAYCFGLNLKKGDKD